MKRKGPNVARIMDPHRREHFVYRYFTEDGRLLYVGCTMRPDERQSEHKTPHSAWPHLAESVEMSGPYTYKKARRIESDAIRTEAPMFNDAGPARRSEQQASKALLNEVFRTAISHGEDRRSAARLALLALDSECAA